IATQARFASKADSTFVTAIGKADLQAVLSGDTAVFGAGRYVGTNYSQTLASALKNGIVAESEGAVAVIKLPKGSRYAQLLANEEPAALLLPNSKFKVVSTEVKTVVQAGKATKVTHYTLELEEDGSAQVHKVAEAMPKAKAEVRAYNKAVKEGEAVLHTFDKEKYSLLGLDTSSLEAAISSGATSSIEAATKALESQMATAKAAALAKAADEPVEWVLAQTYSEADVKAFFANWNKHMANGAGMDDATFLKKIIEKELYYAKKTPDKYPTMGEFIKYMEKLKVQYENKVALAALQPDIDAAIVWAQTTKSAKVKNLVMELQNLQAGGSTNLSSIQAKLAETQKEIDRLEKERLKRLLKKNGGSVAGTTGYDMTAVYNASEVVEFNRLHSEFELALKNAGGNYRDYKVVDAQVRLSQYVTDLGVKYQKQNPILAHLNGASDADIVKAIEDWLNSPDMTSYFGAYHDLGGVYQEAACQAYARIVGVPARELTILRRYTAGQSFVNEYAAELDDWVNWLRPKLKREGKLAEFEKFITGYLDAYNGVCEKLPRYNSHTYRGCSRKYPVAFDRMANELQNAFNNGTEWVVKNPMSTSRRVSVADGFGTDMTFLVRGKTGVDVNPISSFAGEDEYVFRAGTRFRVLRMWRSTGRDLGCKKGAWCVELEEIL
ncbi:MAG: hypothetical protein NC548_53365, partial [Lachnospiraceae bacterium]|nr:hypothetical protein [Lachnospiraceae bacterium]